MSRPAALTEFANFISFYHFSLLSGSDRLALWKQLKKIQIKAKLSAFLWLPAWIVLKDTPKSHERFVALRAHRRLIAGSTVRLEHLHRLVARRLGPIRELSLIRFRTDGEIQFGSPANSPESVCLRFHYGSAPLNRTLSMRAGEL